MFMLQQSQKGDLKDDMFCPQNRLSLFFKELFQFLESFFEDLSGSKTLNDFTLAIHQEFREIPFNGFS